MADNMRREKFFIFLYLCFIVWGQSAAAPSSRQSKEKSSLFLEMTEHLIMLSKEMIPDCAESVANTSECRAKVKLSASLDMAQKLMSEAKQNYPTCINNARENRIPKSRDCTEVLQNGQNVTGVYTIWLDTFSLKNRPLEVFCDMETDGGGWTVIQRRGNFTPHEDFYRGWFEYNHGFGRITKEFWIGNADLFTLTRQAKYKARFDLEDISGNKAYALYDSFLIGDDRTKLHIDGYSGTAGDSMKVNNNMYFSTRDRDNDMSTTHCSRDLLQGGWWYNSCGDCNPNGLYQPGVNDPKTMFWAHWQGYIGLAATEIKLKRNHE